MQNSQLNGTTIQTKLWKPHKNYNRLKAHIFDIPAEQKIFKQRFIFGE
jgi:hypothetical protein